MTVGAPGWSSVVTALALAACLAAAPPAVGQEDGGGPTPVTGWWWRPQPGLGLLPAAHVAEHSLVVGHGPEGPTAIAALRSVIARPTGRVVVTLDVDRATATGNVAVEACVATGAWEPSEAGAWDERPAAACELGRVAGSASGHDETWSFEVTELTRSGDLDIVLLPAADLEATAPPFEIVFAPPAADAVVSETATSATEGGDSRPAVGTYSPPAALPLPTGVSTGPSRTLTPPAARDPSPDEEGAPGVPSNRATSPRSVDGRNRAVAIALIVATLAAVVRRQRSPVGARGIARFVADREATPPPL